MPTTGTLGLPYPADTAPTNVPYDIQQLALGVETALASAWSAYSPSWTGGTAPAIGNGTLTGRYLRVGKTAYYRIRLTVGSTTTFGTGSYGWSLPVGHLDASPGVPLGTAMLFDSSSTTYFAASAVTIGANTIGLIFVGTGNERVSQGVPLTLATGDTITIAGTYETV